MHKWLLGIVFPLYLAFPGYTISLFRSCCFSQPLGLPLRRLALLSAKTSFTHEININVNQVFTPFKNLHSYIQINVSFCEK